MKPDRCSFCKGKLYEGKTEFVAKIGDEAILIKDVTAYICENCGEAYSTPEISRMIVAYDFIFQELQKLVIHLWIGWFINALDIGFKFKLYSGKYVARRNTG